MSKVGFGACQGCGTHATLRTVDVAVPRLPARPGKHGRPAVPAGFCPLIALCGACWTGVVEELRAKATPDSSGAVSP